MKESASESEETVEYERVGAAGEHTLYTKQVSTSGMLCATVR